MSCRWITIMTLSGRTLFWLILCASFLCGKADDASRIRGVPGKDYPIYSSIPQTSFRCSKQLHIPGFYADPETRCQVFHYCYEHRQESFLCPLGTVFNQAILACDYWYSSTDCNAAPLQYGNNLPHRAMIYDAGSGFVPVKNSPDSLLDKIASLYEVHDEFSIPNDSGNESDSQEDNSSFNDTELIIQSKPVIRNRKFAETTDYSENPRIVFDGISKEHEYVLNNDDPEEITENFEDSFEGSGEFSAEVSGKFSAEGSGEFSAEGSGKFSAEPKELEEGSYLWPSNDFDDQQVAIIEEADIDEKTNPHGHSYYENNKNYNLTDFSHVLHSSSKVFSVSEEKLARRYSENYANPSSKKSVRRKPKFTIESQTEAVEQSKDNASAHSIDSIDKGLISASTASMPVPIFPESSVTSYKDKRRRKPIVIDLEDSLQYNINSADQTDGGGVVNYEVNSESEIPGVSILAQEISVKLIPSEAKLKSVRKHLFNQYYIEKEEHTESSTSSYTTSLASNVHYEATPFPNFNKLEESDEDFVMNHNVIIPIRKKNKIPIIDSEDKNDYFGFDDEKQEDTLQPILQFEDEIQPIEKKFQDFEHHSSDEIKEISEVEVVPEISLSEYEVETDPSYFITENDDIKLNNIVPDTHYILQETHNDGQGTLFQSFDLDESYFSHLNNESSLKMEQFVDESEIDSRTDYTTLKSLEGFESSSYDEMQDQTYFTREPISEISTSLPLEIESKKDSETKIYLIPQSNFESEYDDLDISKSTWRPVPEIVEGNHVGKLEYGSFDLHPLLENSILDETTEVPLSEAVEFQTTIRDSYESDTENEHFPNTELTESILYHNNINSIPSVSHDIASNNYAYSEEMSTASDMLDAELELEYISHSNANLESTAKLDVISTEINETDHIKDVKEEKFSDNQRHLLEETVGFDAIEEQNEDLKKEAVLLELNTNSSHPPKLANNDNLNRIDLESNEDKRNVESEGIQGLLDSSNDFPEMSNEFDYIPPVTINSILETSEKSPSWNKAFQNGAFNPTQELSKNPDMKADLHEIVDSNQLKNTERPILNKAHFVLLPTKEDDTKKAKARPLRGARTLASPYQRDFNMEAFGSQYLSGFPASVFKLKQNNIQKLLPYSGPPFENWDFHERTGSLLESPKISKLISIGKNLLRSKKAKFRILSRYINS